MIKLYTSVGCGKCEILKKKLQEAGIDFVESSEMEKLISLGFKSLPVLEVEDQFMNFVDANSWINARSRKSNED